jgi:hypothetical protein
VVAISSYLVVTQHIAQKSICPPLFIILATDIQGQAQEGLRFLIPGTAM